MSMKIGEAWLKRVKIPPSVIRDFHNEYSETGNLTLSTLQQFGALGLDYAVENRGAAGLTIQIDNKTVLTIDAGTSISVRSVKFDNIKIVSAIAYNLWIAGVHIQAFDVTGVMKEFYEP